MIRPLKGEKMKINGFESCGLGGDSEMTFLCLTPTTKEEAKTITSWRKYFEYDDNNRNCIVGQRVRVCIVHKGRRAQIMQTEDEFHELIKNLKNIKSMIGD